MQDRREQARQDLKGLEETVVRKCENQKDWGVCLDFSAVVTVNVRLVSLFLIQGKRTSDFAQPAEALCSGPGYPGEKGDLIVRGLPEECLRWGAFIKCVYVGVLRASRSIRVRVEKARCLICTLCFCHPPLRVPRLTLTTLVAVLPRSRRSPSWRTIWSSLPKCTSR